MFGFQRTMDLIWAFADSRGRGFLLGATAGRTTLNGEGLQHQDGHSLLLASSVPNVLPYDPAFAYEVAVIVEDGLHRMYEEGQDVFYYLTVYNENYEMPAMPEGARDGILEGLYLFRPAPSGSLRAQILGSGPSLQAALAAQEILAERYDVAADVWSATSYTMLRREALDCERYNREHPEETPHVPRVTQILESAEGPVVAVTDWMKAVPDQISRWVPGRFHTLGTDGFGRSDTREALRRYFRVDAENVVAAVLAQLSADGKIPPREVSVARQELGLDGGPSSSEPEEDPEPEPEPAVEPRDARQPSGEIPSHDRRTRELPAPDFARDRPTRETETPRSASERPTAEMPAPDASERPSGETPAPTKRADSSESGPHGREEEEQWTVIE